MKPFLLTLIFVFPLLSFAAPRRVGQIAYMSSPEGNQIEVLSLPGKNSISSHDLEFYGNKKIIMAGSCTDAQKNLKLKLTSMEYELELRLLIQKLRRQKKPRRLSQVQKDFIAEVPACEDFQWELAIISKLLKNYDLDMSRQVSLK